MATSRVDPEKIRQLEAVKAHFRDELLAHPDVTSVGIGFRDKGGKRTREVCLIVTVHRKLPPEDVPPNRLIPERLSFFSRGDAQEITAKVDVQESGVAEMYSCGPCTTDLRARVRPVPGGFNINGGTLGGWVWDNVNDETVLISNHHVLGGTVGANITQPGGGGLADRIAEVVRTASLDATIGVPTGTGILEASIECSGPAVYEVTAPQLDMQVEKVGQTTSLTCGTITQVSIDRGHYGSTNDFRVDTDDPALRFAYYGDSGSLIVERNHPDGRAWKRVVGLLWGGIPSEFNAFAHPIQDVFADLDLTTVCAGLIANLIENLFSSSTSFAAAPGFGPARRSRMLKKGMARHVEKQLVQTRNGREIADLLDRHRADVVGLLLDPDGWRASVAALQPLLSDKVTSFELTEHRITQTDIRNLERVIAVAQKRRPDLKPLIALAGTLLRNAEGRSIGELLGSVEGQAAPKTKKQPVKKPRSKKR